MAFASQTFGNRNQSATTLSYPYRPKRWVMVLVCGFFGVCAYFLGHEAMHNDRGLILNGVIHFSRNGATIFYWCMALICAVATVAGIMGLIAAFGSEHQLTLTATELSAPRSVLSREPTVVRLADILNVELQLVRKERYLKIVHSGGNLTISESYLPDQRVFEDFCTALARRMPKFAQN